MSAADASREIAGNTHSKIANCCAGARVTWSGYQWRHGTVDNRRDIEPVDTNPKRGERHPKSKSVIQMSKSGQEIARFACAPDAARAVNGWGQNLTKCCQGKLKTAYGYIWRYAD